MVPDTQNDIISVYQSLISVFEKMCDLASEKQENIVSAQWSSLSDVVSKQNELRLHVEEQEKRISKYSTSSNNNNIKIIRTKLISLIEVYKEIEAINIRLLKDALYLAKLKANKLFKIPLDDETYSASCTKKSEIIGGNGPLICDRFI